MKTLAAFVATIALAASVALSACGGGTPTVSAELPYAQRHRTASSPIHHIVIVVQENRSFDDFFAHFPGANGARRGKEKVKVGGTYVDKWVTLKAHSLVLGTDLQHCHSAFVTDYDGGKMDGFDLEGLGVCPTGKPAGTVPYQYVNESDIQPYWDIAQQWVLADEMFQTQGSGSFTAHQDLIRGSTCFTGEQTCDLESPAPSALSLVDNPTSVPWGCDAPPGTKTHTIDVSGHVANTGPFPCSKDFPDGSSSYLTLRNLLNGAGVSWKYYTPCFSSTKQPGCTPSSDCGVSPNCAGGDLNAFDVIWPVRDSSEWGTNVSWPETNVFSDITGGKLPAVSWVIPEDANSDHPGEKCGCDDGPSWVASVVDAIGKSKYWGSTAIVVIWDDWGGFYDDAVPPLQDAFGGLGFRVPMMVVSPYAKMGSGSKGGLVSHTQYEFGSILKYIEQNWGLGSLGTTDARATSIGDVFDYGEKARAFKAIPSARMPQYFIERSRSLQHGDPQ